MSDNSTNLSAIPATRVNSSATLGESKPKNDLNGWNVAGCAFLNCQQYSTKLKEAMEIQERHTLRNATDSASLYQSDKAATDHKRPVRRTRSRNTNAMLDRLAPTPGYVDKTPMDLEGGSLAQRRTPRMASLNAAAKVNVFFEPSSPLAGRSLGDIQQHAKKLPSRHSSERKHSDKAYSDWLSGTEQKNVDEELAAQEVFVQGEVTSTWDVPRTTGVIGSPPGNPNGCVAAPAGNTELVENGHSTVDDHRKRKPEADSTSEDERQAKKIYQEADGESACETDKDDEEEMECDTTTDSPKTMVDACIQVDLPRPPSHVKHVRVLSVPIKGQLVTSSGSIAFTKSHLVSPMTPTKPPPELTVSKTATSKRTMGLNTQAMVNTLAANDGPLAKFTSVGSLIDERSKTRKTKEHVNKMSPSSSVTLKIPKINFAATSTSTMSAGRSRPAGNPIKNIHLKNLSVHLERLAERARLQPRQPKVC